MCMYVCIVYVYICVCTYVRIDICVCMYVYVCKYVWHVIYVLMNDSIILGIAKPSPFLIQVNLPS